MKKLIVLLAAAIAVVSCGGGGGGGSSSDNKSTGEPEITNAFIFRMNDPAEKPIMTAEIGEELALFFCFCDSFIDVDYARLSLYYPFDAAQPFEVENGKIEQTEECECWYWGPLVPTPPTGKYCIRIEVRDQVKNWSLPADIEPFVVTQSNVNFSHLTEEKPEKKLWKEE
jgi:hypothetical protein